MIVGIASGKGGVGKTWLAITLAQALAQAGRRVLLVDADLGLANVDVQLGLNPARTIAHVLGGEDELIAAARLHPAGFQVLAGCSGSGALAGLGPEGLRRLLETLAIARARWDVVVLDLGAGIESAVRRLAAATDMLLVVATDEPTSLTDAYAVLKLFRRDLPQGDARVVVNQAATLAGGQRTWTTLDRACAGFLGAGVPLAGVIRHDAHVPASIRRQVPLLTRHPTCDAAEDVRRLAGAMAADA